MSNSLQSLKHVSSELALGYKNGRNVMKGREGCLHPSTKTTSRFTQLGISFTRYRHLDP